ncbi:MAG: NAD(P)-binding protein [Bacteroidetes bacterium]|nr:NAD(P)-binding protein [Bacteroidota bacterium]MDA0943039.1 NAD(P)-binding protein [Bacteroidota bacterium]MDA1111589.1 NAD(P)-binding protein [Bacteroidota bacterium]
MQEQKIAIVGAGITGISIARACHEAGIAYDWYEKESEPGGLLRTDVVDGFALDHGFQVLQSGYSELAEMYATQPFQSYKRYANGAWIIKKGSRSLLSHPKEGLAPTLKTLFNQDISLGDKVKIVLLQQFVSGKSDAELMERPQLQQSTLSFLQGFGFSSKAIHYFFKPWFSGVFLESELQSPASLFCLFYKAFSKGGALLPPLGIQQFARDLTSTLPSENRFWGKEVHPQAQGEQWVIEGRVYEQVVWAAGSNNPQSPSPDYRSAETLYFAAESDADLGIYLALNAESTTQVQTFSIPSNVEPSYAPKGQCLWSVQIRPESFGAPEQDVWSEVQDLLGISLTGRFLRRYTIHQALPIVDTLNLRSTPHLNSSGSSMAGPQFGYPSLQSAWNSGKEWVRIASENQ